MPSSTYTKPPFMTPAIENPTSPEMKKLNLRQRAVVEYVLMTGTDNWCEAARAAGYKTGSDNALKVQAFYLSHHPDIQAALAVEGRKRFGAAIPMFQRVIKEIAEDPTHKDRLNAAKTGLAIAGIAPTQEINVNHNHVLSVDEKLARLAQIRDQLAQMEGPVIDVTPNQEPEIRMPDQKPLEPKEEW